MIQQGHLTNWQGLWMIARTVFSDIFSWRKLHLEGEAGSGGKKMVYV